MQANAMKVLLLSLLLLFFVGRDLLAHPAWTLLIDKQGNFFFSDLDDVWRLRADGAVETYVKGVHTHQLYLYGDSVLYGTDVKYAERTDTWSMRLWKSTAQGKTIDVLPWVTDFREFSGNSFVIDSADVIYYTFEGQVFKRTPEGEIALLSPFQFGRVSTIAPLSGLRVLVADTVGNGTLYAVDMQGKVSEMCANIAGDTLINPPFDVDRFNKYVSISEADGIVYLASWGGRRVLKLDPSTGESTEVYRSQGDRYPVGVAEHDGKLFVLEVGDTKQGLGVWIMVDTGADNVKRVEVYNHLTKQVDKEYLSSMYLAGYGSPPKEPNNPQQGWGTATMLGVILLGLVAVGIALFFLQRNRGEGTERKSGMRVEVRDER